MFKYVFSRMVLVILLGALFIALPTEALAKRKVKVKAPKRPPAKVVKLPAGHKRIVVGGIPYFYHHGVFYKEGPKGYIVAKAPVKARITVLPAGYVTVHVGKVPYYYYYGTYYVYDPDEKVYIVTEPPDEAEAVEVLALDKITLADGTTLEGIYMGGTKNIVQFEVEEKIQDILVEEIISITFAPPSELDE
jgi:hypothetical protein